jgi:Fe2+ transport system protein FeoA
MLSELEVGESGILVSLDLPPGVQNHLMYMGFVPDARVRALHRSPAGDPTVYSVDGIEIALRRDTARAIRVAASSVINETDATLTQAALDNVPPDKVVATLAVSEESAEELTEAIR